MAENLSKADIAKQLSEKLGFLNQAQAKETIDVFLEEIVSNVANGNKIQFLGFGSFEKKHRDATTGKNPKTGEAINIPARDVPKFTAGKQFKDTVNS